MIENLDVKYISGVGPQRATLLAKELNIHSVHDLLYYFPYKYVDRSKIYAIEEVTGELPYIQVRGQITAFETAGEGRGKRLIAHFTDGTGFIDLIWFQGIKYVVNRYKVHQEYIVFGKPTVYNGRLNIAHPDLDPASEVQLSNLGMQPYYNTTEKMKRSFLNSHAIEKMMLNAMPLLKEPLSDTRDHCTTTLDAFKRGTAQHSFPSEQRCLATSTATFEIRGAILCAVEHTAICQRPTEKIPWICVPSCGSFLQYILQQIPTF